MVRIPERCWKQDLGANVIPGGVSFKVWSPLNERVSVRIVSCNKEREVELEKEDCGYFSGCTELASAGERYRYVLDDRDNLSDPASRSQPDGVHGPSQIIDPDEFIWNDGVWEGTSLTEFIIYELHTGVFTQEGTFDAIIPHLDYLVDLGITAVELMPVAQFPGNRNWGYDGVYPYAPQNTYGGPQGLKRLIDATHRKGLAVVMDVVYNHLGPEGNCLHRYGPYFTDAYRTPWGAAVNFDGPYSDEVRHYFVNNALYWLIEYHVDALRLDAIHGIFDFSARHFLEELREAVHTYVPASGRKVYLIAESSLNNVRIIEPVNVGGYGLDSQWNDDFHHALHTLLTSEKSGYYEDFGKIEHLEKTFREGYVYSGQYSRYRKRRHGNSSQDRPARQFVVFSQCHDQVGNRKAGDRLSQTLSLEKLKLAAGAVILSPYVPLLFMGEEYGETSPFPYFISHTDRGLIEAVRNGRRKEFASFHWDGEIPDPQAEETFFSAKLTPALSREGAHKFLFEFYRLLIRLRKGLPVLHHLLKRNMEVRGDEVNRALFIRRWFEGDEIILLYNFGEETLTTELALPEGTWLKLLESSSPQWGGESCLADEIINSCRGEVKFSLKQSSFVLYRLVKGK